jgi:lipoprotein-releasing system ATP-binding protein
MAIIQTRNLTKTFQAGGQDFQVLKGIDLELEASRLITIVGSSGSGKSTLLYVLSTLDTDYEGQILVEGTDLHTLKANQLSDFRNREIGFVFQFHYLLPEFSVLENVMLPAQKLGKLNADAMEAAALEKLDMLGLRDQALKRANQLSGGQMQRVAIARALINSPKIIFGDEPTGNLDSQNGRIVFDIFKELVHNMGQTIIVVTHDPTLAAESDQNIILRDGMVVESQIRR